MVEGCENADIEYHGLSGVSRECQNAVLRLLQFGDVIERARIISCSNTHPLLLTKPTGERIAIKSGFSSGYEGTGPTCFSNTLLLLNAHRVEIDECEVDCALIERLDMSALTTADVDLIDTAKRIRPDRWYDYVLKKHYSSEDDGTLWLQFPPVIPFAIIDSRITDLALFFWEDPDDKILRGYRRLEDHIRKRTGVDHHGTKLFSKVLNGPEPILHWKDIDDGEKTGRVNLFMGTFMAHRNPRAHRELEAEPGEQLTEFLLLNHIYRLEKELHDSEKRD